MIEDFQELLFALCAEPGTPGDESEAARRAARELSDCGETEIDRMGNVICRICLLYTSRQPRLHHPGKGR